MTHDLVFTGRTDAIPATLDGSLRVDCPAPIGILIAWLAHAQASGLNSITRVSRHRDGSITFHMTGEVKPCP